MTEPVFSDVMQVLAAQVAAFAAVLLAASAGHKLFKWSDSRDVVRGFAGLPSWLAPSALGAAALGELSACVLLLLPSPTPRLLGAVLAASIWAAYLAFIVRALLQGRRDVDCGCSFGSSRHPLGLFQVVRGASLLGAALFVAMISAWSGSGAIAASQMLAACALLALYAALDQVMALQPLRRGETL